MLGLLICIEIAVGVSLLALAKEKNLGSVVHDKMTTSMRRYEETGHEGVTKGNINVRYLYTNYITK